ncbi:hypothetical protein SLEP1_g21241 [Rubroshorea leprosula]|uniref:Nucleoside diphosphate kinase-like domain-containing protein n=1 Tax=Rubroshorea leprosula TaxID=152421 RepID=A0AAV5JEK1_9ROSI|nr:hypothetical protein SLEP1_g21241 [Rubroshorea leprosula]
MAREFSASVEYGLRLSKRTSSGKGVPPEPEKMSKSAPESYLPTAVMVYAVVEEPAVMYNPDVPGFQQSVRVRFDRPALIPLHLHEVCMEVDCCMDTAFVTVTSIYMVHCIKPSERCGCRIAVPMGEQGSLLDVEVDIPGPGAGKSYYSRWVKMGDTKGTGEIPKAGDGRFLKPNLYTFNIPQVEGLSKLSIKVSWSQKLLYQEGQFCLNVPFSFPEYVSPVGKTPVSNREKIVLNLNSGIATEILHQCTSHPLKELSGKVQKGSFLYEAEVKAWSAADFNFSYTVSSRDMMGGVLLRSQKEMFCFYLFPGNNKTRKVFRKEVVFIIDNSESMQGAPLGSVKTAVSASLSKLNPEDSFNLISFNGEICLFSSKMEQTTDGSISKATQWLENLTVGAGTNILNPIEQLTALPLQKSSPSPFSPGNTWFLFSIFPPFFFGYKLQVLQMRLCMIQSLYRFLILFVLVSFSPIRSSSNRSIEKERTLAIIKPDGLFGNHSDRIKQVILDSHFNIAKETVVQLDEESAATFYAEHSSKSFFASLINYMTSGPVLVMVLEKENAVADWRHLIGPTDAREAKITDPQRVPDQLSQNHLLIVSSALSIRAMCGLDLQKNCVHGSDSNKSAEREIAFFFKETSSDEAVANHDEL